MTYLKLTNESSVFECFLNKYKKKEAKLVFYGAGGGIIRFADMLEDYGIQPDYICDRNGIKQGSVCLGHSICQIDEIINKNIPIIIVITSVVYSQDIRNYLVEELHLNDEDIFYFAVPYSIQGLQEEKKTFLNHIDKLESVWNHLEDEKSKYVLAHVLNGRITGKQEYFSNVFEDNQYFVPDLIKLDENEVMIDGGAFNGDTIDEFIKQCQGNFTEILAFEPENTMYQELSCNIREKNDTRIKIYQQGLYNKSGKICFDSKNAASGGACISAAEEPSIEFIQTEMIDNLLCDRITFIKLDIEGAELAALKGAEKSIMKYKPKLAICVYHKPEDFFEIPLYILSLNLGYRLYLRHHSDMVNETVLYAV